MLQIALIISLICSAVHFVTREHHLLHPINAITYCWPSWIVKPFYDCILCMGGVWGLTGSVTAFYFSQESFSLQSIYKIAITTICVIGINGVIAILESIHEHLQIIGQRQ